MTRSVEPVVGALNPAERATLALLCDTLVARSSPLNGEPVGAGASASDRGVDREIARVVDEYLSPEQRMEFRRLLRSVISRGTNLILSGRPERFDRLSPPGRERYLRGWAESRLGVKRRGFHALKRLTLFLYYGGLNPDLPDPSWPRLGYRPTGPPAAGDVPAAEGAPPGPPVRGEDLRCDVVVVGSGAGGALIASRLAERGLSVTILESGPYLRGAGFPRREAEAFDRVFNSHGLRTTRDLAIGILAGAMAGGSTTINWMTCLRPPREVRAEWTRDFGLADVSDPSFDRRMDRIESRLSVSTSESDRNPANDALAIGCANLGYTLGSDYEIVARNASGCRSRCQPCSFGCPFEAKRSSLVTHLDDARRAGARLFCDTHADRIEIAGGRATGVEATFAGVDGPFPVRVRAPVTVVAGNAIETPALLLRSGIAGPVGRGLHLHPTAALLAEYDRPIRNWEGPMQTIAVRKFTHRDPALHGPWFESAPAHPGLSALAAPWRGSEDHRALMGRLERAAATIVLVRDYGSGRVRVDGGGRAVVEYRLDRRDRDNLAFGLAEAARIHQAAGARRISTLHTRKIEAGDGSAPVTPAQLARLQEEILDEGIRENALALFSAHPTGSAHAGLDQRTAAADPSGSVYGIEGLWIGDGSLVPTAPGVNPMISIMALADRTADSLLATWARTSAAPTAKP